MTLLAALMLALWPAFALAQTVSDGLPEDNVNVEYWQIITGALLPLALSVINRSTWSRATQSLVAFGVSIIVTVVQLYIYGDLDNIVDPVQAILMVFALSIVFYTGFWKPTGVSPKIEQATG